MKEEVDESSVEKYTTSNPKGMKRTDLVGVPRRKTSGFGSATQMGTNSKVGLRGEGGGAMQSFMSFNPHTHPHTHTLPQCFICGKVIYPVEFVAANEYTFHKSCFR